MSNRIMIDDVMRVITREYGITKADLLSKNRTNRVLKPRQIGMYLARELTDRSACEIGRRFGRDHTTAIHAVKRIKSLLTQDPLLARHIADLIKAVRAASIARIAMFNPQNCNGQNNATAR